VQQHRNALTQSQFDAFAATQDNLRGVDGLYDTNADNDVDWMDAGRIYRHWSEAFEQAANASTGQTALAYHQTAVLFDEYSDMAFATGTALGAYQRLDPD
jgi:hypothetical protein